MERTIKLIDTADNSVLCEVYANHSMMIDELIEYVNDLEVLEKDDCTDPDYLIDGKEVWYDDLEVYDPTFDNED